jgi:hypothetical protein
MIDGSPGKTLRAEVGEFYDMQENLTRYFFAIAIFGLTPVKKRLCESFSSKAADCFVRVAT